MPRGSRQHGSIRPMIPPEIVRSGALLGPHLYALPPRKPLINWRGAGLEGSQQIGFALSVSWSVAFLAKVSRPAHHHLVSCLSGVFRTLCPIFSPSPALFTSAPPYRLAPCLLVFWGRSGLWIQMDFCGYVALHLGRSSGFRHHHACLPPALPFFVPLLRLPPEWFS